MEKQYRQINFAILTVNLHVKVRYKDKLSIMKATHTGSIIDKDLDEVKEVNDKLKVGIVSQLEKIFNLKKSSGEYITLIKHEIIHNQGFTTYKI